MSKRAPRPEGLEYLTEVDPKAPDFMDHPWEFYRRLRETAPVFWDPRHEIFYVTSYELVDQVLKNPELFSSRVDRLAMREGGVLPRVFEIRAQGWQLALTMSANDAPSHEVYKALVSPFFTPQNLTRIEPFVRSKAGEQLSAVPRGEAFDFVTAVAVPLPIAVIGRHLGLSEYGDATLKMWSDAIADDLGLLASEERSVEAAELTLQCHRAIVAVCEARRQEPRDDIASHLANARIPGEDGERSLDETELISMLAQMLVAGNETTTNTLSSGIKRLALDEALLPRLKAEPGLVRSFVEELLRLEAPVQGQFRQTNRATELGGVAIPEGALLHVRLASANRDESVFGANSSELNLEARPPAPHKSFGAGMHFCLGAMLSRMELNIVFTLIADQLEKVALAVPATDLHYASQFHLRGLRSLPVIVS